MCIKCWCQIINNAKIVFFYCDYLVISTLGTTFYVFLFYFIKNMTEEQFKNW